MPFAVELYFDRETDEAIRGLWGALDTSGSPGHGEDTAHPHVSLVVSDGHQPGRLREDLAKLDWASLRTLRFGAIGYFADPGVLYLAANPSVPLLNLQQDTYDIVARRDPAQVRSYYRPGNWTPHCTLAMPLQPHQLPHAIEAIGGGMDTIHARITGVGMWSLGDHQPWKLDLDGPAPTGCTEQVVDLRDRDPSARPAWRNR